MRKLLHGLISNKLNWLQACLLSTTLGRLCIVAGFALAACAGLCAQIPNRITREVDPARAQVLTNHHPLWANSANDAGPLPADAEMGPLTLVLRRSAAQEQALEQLLADQQNPGSPEFHHWLTPAEVGERFGLSDADIATVSSWLQSQGLQVNWVSPSRIFIGFSGSAQAVGQAFGTAIHSYTVHGKRWVSAATDPMIPQALAPVIMAVRGLYTIEERPLHQVTPVALGTPQMTTSGGSHYLAPADFNTIYDVPPSLTGAGVTIGIVGEARTDFADFANFRALTGATFANPTEIIPTAFGGADPGPAYTSPPSGGSSNVGNQSEATLDVFRSGSVAPAANLLLVTASAASGGIGVDLQYLVQTTPIPASVISISFGACESDMTRSEVTSLDSLFQQAAAEGISVFVSSGDSGASGCDAAFTTPPASPAPNSPNALCSSSYVTCVGGTEFNDASNPSQYWNSSNSTGLLSALGYIPEGGWNEPGTASAPMVAASGGGVSAFITKPSWQTGTGVPSTGGRYTPDVSFSGSCHDAYFGCLAAGGASCTVTNGSYQFVGYCGTSAAAPGMAGVAALLDQKLGTAQGNLNPAIYQESTAAPQAFHDATAATSGVSACSVSTPSMCNNSIPGQTSQTGGQAGFLLTTGFDEVTGLGSLDVAQFLNGFSGAPPTAGFTISGTSITLAPGATSGNVSTITVTPTGGFTGTVTLTAAILSSPSGAQNLPTLSFGSSNTVNITGTTAQQAALTISTTAPSSGALNPPVNPAVRRYGAGGAIVACLLLCWLPMRRRDWQNLLGLAVLAVMMAGVQSCSSGSSSSGSSHTLVTPTVTVTPSPTSITTTQKLAVNVVVAGGSATPSGTVSLVSGSYAYPTPVTLASGSATFNIPAGSLAVGTDPLNVSYAPDSSSSATFNYASGSNTVVVATATNPGTTAGTYTIRVTGTSGSVTSVGTLTLVVQ